MAMPALLTSTSSRPCSVAICLTAASTAAASATSKRDSAPCPPASLIVRSVSAAAASFAV